MYYGKRSIDNYVTSENHEYRRGGETRKPKLLSHRFHFTNPSTMTLTVTHQNDDVVMYMRRQGGWYMSMNESEFCNFLHSVEEINEKIRQCKLVMAGKLPPTLGSRGAVFYSAKIQGNFEAAMEQITFGQG